MSVGRTGDDDPGEHIMRNRLRDSLFGASPQPVRVGRYLIVDQLGAGGLGIVYGAYDPKLDRRVALKLLHPERSPLPDTVPRMEREAQSMARLAHPNVVAVHDTGTHAGGVFIAMECIDGLPLNEWAAQTRPDWRSIRDVLCQAGRGLAAAHAVGLVHRDFKPSNVLVTPSGKAKVLDFGLSRTASEAPAEAVLTEPSRSEPPLEPGPGSLTEAGTVMGTPAFMSPEQFTGHADARSDQWSYCVSAWQCFYGKRPFPSREPRALLASIREGTPPQPPNSSLPGWLVRALHRGLRPNAAQRFESMDALLWALDKDKRSRRRQRTALVAVVLGSALAGAAATTAFEPRSPPEVVAQVNALEAQARTAASDGHFVYPPSSDPSSTTALLAVLALEGVEGHGARQAAQRAQQLRGELAVTLTALGDAYASLDGGEAFAADYYASALLFDPRHAPARAHSPLTPGELATLRTRAEAGTFTPAELVGGDVLAALADEDPQSRSADVSRVRAATRRPSASTEARLDRMFPATAAPQPAPRPTRATETDPPSSTETETETEADPEAPNPKPKDSRARAQAEVTRGLTALAAGNRRAAEQAFHRALNFDRKNARALRELGALAFDRGEYQRAVNYARKATRHAPRVAAGHMELGDALYKVHRYDDAREAYSAAKKLGARGAAKALARIDAMLGDAGQSPSN
ncbi:MAG: protein kinase domain-containing protein [Nannocystales bacterium]